MSFAVPIPQGAQNSGLPRTIDFNYPSNRFAVGAAAASVLASRLLGASWREAASVGVSAFTAWACARELDPDHPDTATVALPVAAASAWMGGPGSPVAAAAALAGVRILAGSVGRVDPKLDVPALAALTALNAASGHRSASIPVAAAGLVPGLNRPWVALLPLLPTVARGGGASLPGTLLSLGAVVAVPTTVQPEAVAAPTDHPPGRVQASRLQFARRTAALALASSVVLKDSRSTIPLAAAFLATGLRRAAHRPA